jgi:hypothetical protein
MIASCGYLVVLVGVFFDVSPMLWGTMVLLDSEMVSCSLMLFVILFEGV